MHNKLLDKERLPPEEEKMELPREWHEVEATVQQTLLPLSQKQLDNLMPSGTW